MSESTYEVEGIDNEADAEVNMDSGVHSNDGRVNHPRVSRRSRRKHHLSFTRTTMPGYVIAIHIRKTRAL